MEKLLLNVSFIFLFAIVICSPLIIYMIIKLLFYYCKYKKSNYKYESGVSFFKFFFDIGSFGEGLTFMQLEQLECYSKILTNVYLPTEDGTTEVDLLYITNKGIYAIESKNYSGWIFGDENSKYWTMVLYKYRKKFLNPIWQNKKHIKYLKQYISYPITSLIVFSERCQLKKIKVVGENVKVFRRNKLVKYIEQEYEKNDMISNEEINKIYTKLKKYCLVSDELKQQHINQIKNRI